MSQINGVVVHEENARVFAKFEPITKRSISIGQLRVAPSYVGICGSDLDQLFGKTDVSFKVDYPHILGHEWSGTVIEASSDVSRFTIGDRIIGHGSLGENRWFGVSTDGAMADSFLIPQEMCFKIPDNVSFLRAALVEPLACSLNALRNAGGTDAGQTVIVLGCGAIGLSMVALASNLGARVIAIDPSPLRLELAREFGAELVVEHFSNQETLTHLVASSDFAGADLVVEASGVALAQALSIDLAGQNGRILLMGLGHKTANDVSIYQLQNKNLKILSSVGAPPGIWEPTLRFLSRSGVDLSPMVSDIFSFSEIEGALQAARDSSRHAKVLVSAKGK